MTVRKKGSRRGIRPQRTHKLGYIVLNFFLGAILFVIGYMFFLAQMDHNLVQLGMIILWNGSAGIVASLFCRWFMRYWDFQKSFNFYFRGILIILISSLFIWLGLFGSLFDRYNISLDSFSGFIDQITGSAFWEFIIIVFLLKMFVFFASDYFSDKVAFGG